MHAIICQSFGPPELLSLGHVPEPALEPGTVRVRIAAAGVSFPDGLVVQGLHQYRHQHPFIPGGEVAGHIVDVSANVDGFHVGDRVLGLCFVGAWAENVVVRADRVVPLRPEISNEVGCSLGATYGTAIHAYARRADLKPGEKVLVLGAAGGSGVAAIQVAKAMGAEVIAAASTEEKCAFARQVGADRAFVIRTESFRDDVRQWLGTRGPDVVFDPVGGALFEPALRTIAPDGRYLVVGFASGDIPAVRANIVLLKSCSVVGIFAGRYLESHPAIFRADLERVMDWMVAGKIKPPPSIELPLADAAKALRALIDRKAIGKYVLRVRPD